MPKDLSKEDIQSLTEFGQRLKHIRKEKGMTQDELEYKAGVHDNMVGRLERAERTANYLQILKISTALEIDPSQLFKDSPEKNSE